MAYKILEQNGVEIENVDGAAFNNFSAGGKDCILKDVLQECNITTASNYFIIYPGVLVIQGVRIKITEEQLFTMFSAPTTNLEYQLVGQVQLNADRDLDVNIFVQVKQELTRENIFVNEQGTYQAEIASFVHNTNGNIEDLTVSLPITHATAEPIGTPVDGLIVEGNLLYLAYNNEKVSEPVTLPQGGGSSTTPSGKSIVVITKINTEGLVDTYQILYTDNTTSTFTVTNGAKGDKGDKGDQGQQGIQGEKGEQGVQGQDGIGIENITAGTPTQDNGYTVTPITFKKTNGVSHIFDIKAKNGENGTGGSSVEQTPLQSDYMSMTPITTTINGKTYTAIVVNQTNVTLELFNSIGEAVLTDIIKADGNLYYILDDGDASTYYMREVVGNAMVSTDISAVEKRVTALEEIKDMYVYEHYVTLKNDQFSFTLNDSTYMLSDMKVYLYYVDIYSSAYTDWGVFISNTAFFKHSDTVRFPSASGYVRLQSNGYSGVIMCPIVGAYVRGSTLHIECINHYEEHSNQLDDVFSDISFSIYDGNAPTIVSHTVRTIKTIKPV